MANEQGGAQVAKEPMADAKPGELETLVNIKTGERVKLFPIDAREYRDPKRHPDHADWVPEGHRLDPGLGGDARADEKPVQTVKDLNPDPPPLPGEAKAGKGGK